MLVCSRHNTVAKSIGVCRMLDVHACINHKVDHLLYPISRSKEKS